MAKLGILYGFGLSSKLTKLFTGSTAYHVFWKTDEFIYDMHFNRRRLDSKAFESEFYTLFDFPSVTKSYLEDQLTFDRSVYGFRDYFLFALRPLYHMFGKSTRNFNGLICSEMVNNDLISCGYNTPWDKTKSPPAPADIERWLRR